MQPVQPVRSGDLLAVLGAARIQRGGLLALSLSPCGLGLASAGTCWAVEVPTTAGAIAVLTQIEQELRPRWVWWSAHQTARILVDEGLRPAVCWDLAETHRLLAGGGPHDPAHVWALALGLEAAGIPRTGQLDLWGADLTDGTPATLDDRDGDPEDQDDPDNPVSQQGYLRAEWVDGGWARSVDRLARWSALALAAQGRQSAVLERTPCGGDPLSTAAGESAAALLCVELETDGLPVNRETVERLLADSVGPRPRDPTHEATLRHSRDDLVLDQLPAGAPRIDLRHPAQVRAALAQIGIEVADTRSWRLEPWRDQHPFVAALLDWRKSDRLATTYGYRWLDEHVGHDGRLRGAWRASDGAAGRMTAQAGLHNLPAELRPAVVADEGHLFVRADLGQVEPRVLAAISGDPAFVEAAAQDDLYAPVARRLHVDREVAKVAVLAAMYGQTSGTAGQALAGLQSAYPVAMRFLAAAYEQGWSGQPVRTHGGRLVHMPVVADTLDEAAHRAALAARGRYARNAVVQGSAAELFKQWAVTVRTLCRSQDARIVLCLHDELVVQVREADAQEVARMIACSLPEVAGRWAPDTAVRFVADVSVIRRWSEAKG